MKVRAKFYVDEITHYSWGGSQVKMRPVMSNDEMSENKLFWDATPTGEIEMTIKNETATKYFEVGKEYYIDFTLAESDEDGIQ